MESNNLVYVSRTNGESIDLSSWRAGAQARAPRQHSEASNESEPGKLDGYLKLSPLILEELNRRGIKVSDCEIIDERTVRFP